VGRKKFAGGTRLTCLRKRKSAKRGREGEKDEKYRGGMQNQHGGVRRGEKRKGESQEKGVMHRGKNTVGLLLAVDYSVAREDKKCEGTHSKVEISRR